MKIYNKGILKMTRHKQQTDTQGAVTAEIKIPGIPGQDARLFVGGSGWFDTHHADDLIEEVWIEDKDGLIPTEKRSAFLNYPKIANYTDMVAPTACQGWFFPPSGVIDIRAVADVREVGSGFYLKIKVKKGNGLQEYLRMNIIWGDPRGK